MTPHINHRSPCLPPARRVLALPGRERTGNSGKTGRLEGAGLIKGAILHSSRCRGTRGCLGASWEEVSEEDSGAGELEAIGYSVFLWILGSTFLGFATIREWNFLGFRVGDACIWKQRSEAIRVWVEKLER